MLQGASVLATDHVRVEWHLTPRGWVRGDWSINKPLGGEFQPPDDRVETWVRTETSLDADFSRTQDQWSLTWTSPESSEADRTVMRATVRHPAPESESSKATSWDFPV